MANDLKIKKSTGKTQKGTVVNQVAKGDGDPLGGGGPAQRNRRVSKLDDKGVKPGKTQTKSVKNKADQAPFAPDSEKGNGGPRKGQKVDPQKFVKNKAGSAGKYDFYADARK